jgi:hypothetical protein
MVGILSLWLLRFEEILIRAPKDEKDMSSTERFFLFVL